MTDSDDPFDLIRFIEAQDGTYERALSELRRGRKTTHWMWFVFPQMAGLGRSEMSRRYAIHSLDEARAYLEHPVLGPRLRDCVGAVQDLDRTTVEALFGEVDAKKFGSSLTLFSLVTEEPLFSAALRRWFGGTIDLPQADAVLHLKLANDRGVG